MGKIFSVFGNFYKKSFLSKSGISFRGKIILDEESNRIYGYCNLLDTLQTWRSQYFLAGTITENGDGTRGAAVYRLSNDPAQEPIMFLISNFDIPDRSVWATPNSFDTFLCKGEATFHFVELPYSPEAEKDIKRKYNIINDTVGINGSLLWHLERREEIAMVSMM